MAGFLYFLPSAIQRDIPGELNRWGLSYLQDDAHRVLARGCTGPRNMQGMVIGSSANWDPTELKYQPGWQWSPFPKTHADKQAFLGYDPSQPLPRPQDLIRPDIETIKGAYLPLADGNRWLIPNARVVTEDGSSTCNLPAAFDLDEESGEWIANQVLPKYRKIWKHANTYLESMFAAIESAMKAETPPTEISWEIEDFEGLVIDALQVNYRVSARELATLGVLTSDIARKIGDILIDDAGFERIKKKEASDIGDG